MRTTLTMPDNAYQIARSYADSRGIGLGEAVGELIRRALHPAPAINDSMDFPCFILPANAEPITLEETLAAQEDW